MWRYLKCSGTRTAAHRKTDNHSGSRLPVRFCKLEALGGFRKVGDSMKITTDRGTLFTTASGKSILRWNKNAPPTEENFDQLQKFIDNTVVRHMDAYVPMRTGMLKSPLSSVRAWAAASWCSSRLTLTSGITARTGSLSGSAVQDGFTECGRRLRTRSSGKSKITQGG